MKKIIKSLVGLSLIWMITSCEKDELVSTASKRQFDMSTFFAQTEPSRQNFSFTAGQYKQIIGTKGTRITFFANSFKRANGQIVTSGTINIVLQEMLTGPEMILANKSTTSNGGLLKSGGQILLKAYQNGEELLVNKASRPVVEIPTKNNDDMNVFYGTVKVNDSLVGDTSVNWNVDTTTNVNVVNDSFSNNNYYNFQIDSFNYINCDKFYDQNPKSDVKITVPATFVDSNTAVFLYFPAINSVARVYKFDKTTNSFILDGGYAVPIGMNVKIVMVAKKGTQYYYEIKTATITSNFTTTMNPTTSDINSIKTAISNM